MKSKARGTARFARRVLLVSYYFPPSGGPGVQRALKFVKYLPEFGWQPTVLTVRQEDAAYPDLDPTLCTEVPDTVEVVSTRAWDPYALYAWLQGKEKHETVSVSFLGEAEMSWKQKLGRWIRANIFLPDARVGWVPFAIRRGRALLEAEPYDAVLTTGPPHSAHLIGWTLARRYGLPWVADFRDPWTGINFYELLPMTALARATDAALERLVLQRASAVTVVSPTMRRHLKPRTRASCTVIPNGFDPADFAAGAVEPASDFVLAYVGNLNEAQNPLALWRALQALEAPVQMPDLRVRLIGNVDPVVLASARQHSVAEPVDVHPYIPHAEAVREMQQSTLLLLLINRVSGAEGIMTGKLYEYIASGRPVLGIGPPQGDVAGVLKVASAGCLFDYDDVEGITAFLQQHYGAWQVGTPQRGANAAAAASYSRKSQTGAIAALLDQLVHKEHKARLPYKRAATFVQRLLSSAIRWWKQTSGR